MIYYREALDTRRHVLSDEHPETLAAIGNMGNLLRAQGKLAEAEPYYREALEARRRVLGDEHPNTLISASNLALLLIDLGDPVEAERLALDTVNVARSTIGPEHWFAGNFLGKHGRALAALGRYDEAEAARFEAHGTLVAALGDRHGQTTRVVGYLADLYDAWGKPEQAAEWRSMLPVEQEATAKDEPAAKEE